MANSKPARRNFFHIIESESGHRLERRETRNVNRSGEKIQQTVGYIKEKPSGENKLIPENKETEQGKKLIPDERKQ